MWIKSKLFWLVVAYLFFQLIWWFKLHVVGGLDSVEAYWFNIGYGFIGLVGGISGLIISLKHWGGTRSLVGKSIFLLSLGLMCEWIANILWGYYNIALQVDVPYPSVADAFFFAVIPFYAFAMVNLAKASGAKITLKSYKGRLNSILIPFAMLGIAYMLFLRQGLDTSNPVRLFFDIAYPLGEAITFSIAILTFLLTKDYLGGMMRKIVMFVLVAYLVQFVADYGFLYTALQGTYYNANWVDMLYAVALTFMSIAILQFESITDSLDSNELVKAKGSKDDAITG